MGTGEVEAWARDTVNGQRSFQKGHIPTPGCVRRPVYSLRLLQAGESLSFDPSTRLLRNLGETFRQLLLSWLSSLSGNCLSEAAGVVAASCLLPLDPTQGEGFLRERIDRIRRLWLPGSGFRDQDPELSLLAARLLRSLSWLQPEHPGLQQPVQQGLTIAQDLEYLAGRPWPPQQPGSCQDAYFSLRSAGEVSSWMQSWLQSNPGSAMAAEIAYAAACCLRLRWRQALPLCQQALRTLDPDPGLRHPSELAAIALLLEELLACPEFQNGVAELSDSSLRAVQGIVAVQASAWLEEDWLSQPDTLELNVELESALQPGQTVFLRLTLPQTVQAGDMVWIFLPDSLCRLQGGGQMRSFSLEFPPQVELLVPLLSLRAGGNQPLWVGLRNFLQPGRRATRTLA